jgi:hypothetical protein
MSNIRRCLLAGACLCAIGCTNTTDSSAELRWRRRPPDAGAIASDAGTTTTAATCDLCTQTQACCLAVDPSGNCTFSAETCRTGVSDAARPYYIQACLVELVTIRGAWGGNPPEVCR